MALWIIERSKQIQRRADAHGIMMKGYQKMIIKEQFIEFVPEAISLDSDGVRKTAAEIKHQISEKYGTNWNSVIPSDYCYNDGEKR